MCIFESFELNMVSSDTPILYDAIAGAMTAPPPLVQPRMLEQTNSDENPSLLSLSACTLRGGKSDDFWI